MLALHYYSDSESVRATLRQVAAAWWSQDDDPVYSKDLIKEFEVEDPPLEDELAWILSKGTRSTRELCLHIKRDRGNFTSLSHPTCISVNSNDHRPSPTVVITGRGNECQYCISVLDRVRS